MVGGAVGAAAVVDEGVVAVGGEEGVVMAEEEEAEATVAEEEVSIGQEEAIVAGWDKDEAVDKEVETQHRVLRPLQ